MWHQLLPGDLGGGAVELALGLSLLANVALLVVLLWREAEHHELEDEQKLLNRCMREELWDLIRRGRIL